MQPIKNIHYKYNHFYRCIINGYNLGIIIGYVNVVKECKNIKIGKAIVTRHDFMKHMTDIV